jgi:hypothetical protein
LQLVRPQPYGHEIRVSKRTDAILEIVEEVQGLALRIVELLLVVAQ